MSIIRKPVPRGGADLAATPVVAGVGPARIRTPGTTDFTLGDSVRLERMLRQRVSVAPLPRRRFLSLPQPRLGF